MQEKSKIAKFKIGDIVNLSQAYIPTYPTPLYGVVIDVRNIITPSSTYTIYKVKVEGYSEYLSFWEHELKLDVIKTLIDKKKNV